MNEIISSFVKNGNGEKHVKCHPCLTVDNPPANLQEGKTSASAAEATFDEIDNHQRFNLMTSATTSNVHTNSAKASTKCCKAEMPLNKELHSKSPSSATGETATTSSPVSSSTSSSAHNDELQLNRFADYFVICGLDLDTGLEPDRFTGDNLHCSPLDRAYKSKPLAYYPENVPWNPFDAHGICMLSLPQGLRFRTQKHNTEPKFHAFATTREDGKRCYGFSLVFYEEIRNRNICSAMHTLQSMFITELSNGLQSYKLSRVKESPVSRSLPRHFKVAGQAPQSAQSYYDITKDKLYVAKSISLICQIPYAFAAEMFLTNLYKCLPRQPGPGISLESYVYNILYEVLLPQPGKSIRIYLPPMEAQLPAIALILQRPDPSTDLPLLDFPLRLLFTYLGVECVIQLLTCILLESQVLLRSNDYQKLMIVAECITAVLFPFVWPHVYAPILPAALHHFLDAPVPFVMGLHADCEAANKIGSEATLCFVDIDRKLIQLPEEIPVFPHKHDFMAEIISILDKFEIERDRSFEPNLKMAYSGCGYPASTRDFDVMMNSCTLPSGIQSVKRQKDRFHQLQETVYTLGKQSLNDDDQQQNNSLHYQPLMMSHTSARIDNVVVPRISNYLQRRNSGRNSSSSSPVRFNDRTEAINCASTNDNTNVATTTPTSTTASQSSSSSSASPTRTRLKDSLKTSTNQTLTNEEQYYQDLRINNALREIFFNRFVHMFFSYEYFVIYPNQERDEWLSNRETLQNFDKSSFLSDQPEHHRPFLSRFLESQMFATLVDNKILSVWDKECETNLKIFDQRIKLLRNRHGENMICATSYEPCVISQESQQIFEKRLRYVDLEVTSPSEILANRAAYFRSFPILEKSVLNQECISRGNSLRRVKNNTNNSNNSNGSNSNLNTKGTTHHHRKWYHHKDSNHLDRKYVHSNATSTTTTNVTPTATTTSSTLTATPLATTTTSTSNNSINRLSANLTSVELSPALIAQANWTFVEKLLKDIKSKTKRMLLEKMGTEGVSLGVNSGNVGGNIGIGTTIEENTLIASLCDLLEKIWSHGLHNKQGKSALWTHLHTYVEIHENDDNKLHNLRDDMIKKSPSSSLATAGTSTKTPIITKNTSNKIQNTEESSINTNRFEIGIGGDRYTISAPAIAWNVMRKRMDYLSTFQTDVENIPSPNRSRSLDRNRFNSVDQLCPLPESLEFDVKNVMALADIKTQFGYTRAWVRLALEKKLLSRHFRTLLSDDVLLRSLYKRSAFLRCEDEKEQFLFHLLSLNTVDYYSFTSTYPTTKLPYRVVIFPARKHNSHHTSSNVWIMVSGTLNETQRVPVPKGSLEFIFHYRNLGLLTTMRIGHDNFGPTNKWLVEHVIMRNEVTGHTYKFPCGRWLGKGVDDDSTERLLVGQRLSSKNVPAIDLSQSYTRTPPRTRSPSIQRGGLNLPSTSEIQHNLGNCVNSVVKWHYKPSRDRDVGTLTNLLCGDNGLVQCLENVFLCGFRSTRFFGRNLYIWDYFSKIKEQFEQYLQQVQQQQLDDSSSSIDSSNSCNSFQATQNKELLTIWRCYIHLIDEINNAGSTLGKDGKFQLLICLSLREHLLTRMIRPMAVTKVTQEMYEEESFLRRKNLLTFLVQILEPLDDCHIVLENSITQGIPSQC